MSDSVVYLQPAFILQHRNYRESSLLVDAFTRDFGRISLLAKGVRKPKSRSRGLLQPFIPLAVSFTGKAELKTLTCVEIVPPYAVLNGLALYCGFYVNELAVCFLHKYDPHPEVFAQYAECLSQLASGMPIEPVLRNFEINLIDRIGYGLQLEYDAVNRKPVEPSKNYHFDIEQGPLEADDGDYSGKTLQAISSRDFTDPAVLNQAKALIRRVLDVYLQGKPLKSRAVFNSIMKQL
ncbi:MAG: DNA repair protein RecO [Gammaproteobacteria bacterium]